MTQFSDDELGLDRPITRRDFIDGLAVGAAGAAAALSGLGGAATAIAQTGGSGPKYPPTVHGIAGQTDAAMRVGHAVRDGEVRTGRVRTLDEEYDLVVVGGGVSGLAAAYFYRQANPKARILVLEALADFGGHQHRNEFTVRGRTLLSNGGMVNLDSWGTWEKPELDLMDDLGIDLEALEKREDPNPYAKLGLQAGYFFPQEAWGADAFVVGKADEQLPALLARTPFSPEAQAQIVKLETTKEDFLAGQTDAQKKAYLARISYREYLQKHVGLGDEAIKWVQRSTHGLWGVGAEAVPAGDAWGAGELGFEGLKLEPKPYNGIGKTPRMILSGEHQSWTFPDGGATVSRLLVDRLVPGAYEGTAKDMFGITLAKAKYARLDRPRQRVRIRLRSMAVDVRHARGGSGPVEVTYLRDGQAFRVRGRHAVMACWSSVAARIVDGLPQSQRKALNYAPKVPLVYARVAIDNWQAFAKAGVRSVQLFDRYFDRVSLMSPTTFGRYETPRTPDQPIVLSLSTTPNDPAAGLTHAQHRAGRGKMMGMDFRAYEREIRDVLARTVGASGFDPARDVKAVTINRWAHGYAYEYNSLQDPAIFRPLDEQPFAKARRTRGNIAIANSDAAAFGYTHAAINEAHRAVSDLVG